MAFESQALPNEDGLEGDILLSSGLHTVEPFEFVADISISKAYPVTVKKAEGDVDTGVSGDWVVEGFASTTDLDSQNHTITKEAIEQGALSLQTYTTLLFNHDPNRPIGHVAKSQAQDGKLFIKAIISPSEPIIWKKIQDGTLSKFSVFGKILDAEEGELDSKQILVIKSMELYEVSVVSVPANAAAKAIAWYVEKALMSKKGVETGFSPQTLVPQSYITQLRLTSDGKDPDKDTDSKKDKKKFPFDFGKKPNTQKGGNPMAENANMDQAINLLKLELETAEGEMKQQLTSQITALESLQKGEGPMDNDMRNKDAQPKVKGNPTVNVFPTNFAPDTKKVSVGNEANLELTAEGLMQSLEGALLALQNASPEFDDDDGAIATRVIQWLESKIADVTPGTSDPGSQTRVQRSSAEDTSDAFSKAIFDLKTIAQNVTQEASNSAQVLAEVRGVQKSISDTAAAIVGVVEGLGTTSMRKGQGPEAEGDERVVDDGNTAMDIMQKAVGTERFNQLTPRAKLDLYLNTRVAG